MNNNKHTPEIIEMGINKNWTHVFFVVNPIVALITKMIILNFKINPSNILIFSFRNTDLSLLDYNHVFVDYKHFDRYFEKLFFQSPSGKRILRKIKTLKKPFLLYAPQAFREVNYLLRSDICMGHIYVEEGQLAYTKIKEFIPKQVSLLDNFLRNWRNRFNDKDEIGFYFRNDSSCYLGITNDSFPEINQDKKYILQNINSVKKFYKPKLIGIENIGLTCAWRRLDRKNWSKMLKILIKEMNGEGVIKLHPSFTSSKKIEEDITKVFQKLETKKIDICSNDVNVELEMLYERKEITGFQTSLSKYATIFGSDFNQLSYELIK
tara:strand:+ start:30 stop:995 length:966 start_codon:yes stop_codon:yes gene_type:complete